MTGVSECSQQRGNLKDDGYKSCDTPIHEGAMSKWPYFLELTE
ncbi:MULTISPECIES: hypothetical protein [Photorhabdus]|uniref:Uncharacterized protein n=1 Tax=Photorhabdus bodei TaxID=2029681 RepID=A0AAW6BG20_9GAMM|nr:MULTISPECIES: hypothetical protein [Photorhabdus]MDB6368732.1 hypothetical protein [Photorhabdus bodei]MDB6370954.1 hypothetical protein [Photorhabdus bodei]